MKNKEVIDHITGWLQNYCSSSLMNGFVIGVSGGIDSALTSTLCAHTGLPTLVISMPIRQHKPEHDRASEHITWLKKNFPNVSAQEVDLTPVFEKIEEILPKGMQVVLSMHNPRARVRMTTLYAFAGMRKMLVAGTGNKVEDFGVGFY